MEWRPVLNFEGWYEVSDRGFVRSVERTVHFSDGRVRRYQGQRLRFYADDFGYRKVTLKKNGLWVRVHVHLLVAEAFKGPRPPGLQVRHYDGDHLNNRPDNLIYGSPLENHADTKRHGRVRRFRKLTDATVAAIRKARGRETCRALALKYNTSAAHVCNIQLGHRRA